MKRGKDEQGGDGKMVRCGRVMPWGGRGRREGGQDQTKTTADMTYLHRDWSLYQDKMQS